VRVIRERSGQPISILFRFSSVGFFASVSLRRFLCVGFFASVFLRRSQIQNARKRFAPSVEQVKK